MRPAFQVWSGWEQILHAFETEKSSQLAIIFDTDAGGSAAFFVSFGLCCRTIWQLMVPKAWRRVDSMCHSEQWRERNRQ